MNNIETINEPSGYIHSSSGNICQPGKHLFFHWFGLLTQLLKLIRQTIRPSYHSPRPFPVTEFSRAIEHDLDTVEMWEQNLTTYTGRSGSLKSKSILELGPGADLGIGLTLLGKGAARYYALDAYPLAKNVTQEFYDRLFGELDTHKDIEATWFLKEELALTQNETPRHLNYIVDRTFSMNALERNSIELVFSNAAFEHFDSIPDTFAELSSVVKPGAVMVALVDLQTHHPWFRKHDPLNMYRYSHGIYETLKYRGSPNRMRPYEYVNLLEKSGWTNIVVHPRKTLSDEYMKAITPHLAPCYRDPVNQMHLLGITICATKQ